MHGLKLGTRGSPLALAQARKVAAAIETAQRWPEGYVEVITLKTTGDKVQDRPLSEIGGEGPWTKELHTPPIDGKPPLFLPSMEDGENGPPKENHIPSVGPR